MRKFFSVVVASLFLLAGVAAPSYAGPDSGKNIMYNAHVDAPKVYWQGDNFTLRSNAAGESRPLENTVNWLGRGYSVSGSQLFAITAPEGDELSFMGVSGGDFLSAAPAVNGKINGPIWSGFGADTDIPVELFRDNKFDLEIVDFDGPGRMEMLTYYEGFPLRRFLSSHDPYLRQTWVDPGNHTHNQTLFTRPGRYEVTFRATARDQKNRIIASQPQKLVWQVGGPNPELETITDVISAYNAAPETGSGNFAPQLEVAPNTVQQADGDDLLSTLTFTTGNQNDNGAVIFYVDGYYLGEVPLRGGVAQWNEMLGSQDLDLQAVFIPSTGSPSPRWITAPLHISRNVRAGITDEAGTFPDKIVRDPAPKFTTAEYTPSSPQINFVFKNSEEHAKLTVTPTDENLWFKVEGGAYEPGSEYPTCDVSFVSTPNNRTWDSGDWWDCVAPDMEIRLNIVTPNSVTMAGTTANFLVTETNPKPVMLKVVEDSDDSDPTDEDPTDPDPVQPTPNPPDDTELVNTPVQITTGHVDIRPVVSAGEVKVAINDDSREHAKKSVVRTPDSVTLVLRKNSRVERSPKSFGDPVFDFLGNMGTQIYVSPMQQKDGIVWPGFSTEDLDRKQFPNGIKFQIESDSIPEGGSWWLFTHDSFNGLDLIASNKSAGEIVAKEPLHKHVYWGFNKPGNYKIKIRITGEDVSGKAVNAAANINFLVLDDTANTGTELTPGNTTDNYLNDTLGKLPAQGGSAIIAPTANCSTGQLPEEQNLVADGGVAADMVEPDSADTSLQAQNLGSANLDAASYEVEHKISVPLIIIVVCTVLSLVAGTVLLKRKLALRKVTS